MVLATAGADKKVKLWLAPEHHSSWLMHHNQLLQRCLISFAVECIILHQKSNLDPSAFIVFMFWQRAPHLSYNRKINCPNPKICSPANQFNLGSSLTYGSQVWVHRLVTMFLSYIYIYTAVEYLVVCMLNYKQLISPSPPPFTSLIFLQFKFALK